MVMYFGRSHRLADHALHVSPLVVSGINALPEVVQAEFLGTQEAFPTTRRMAAKRSNFEVGDSVSCQYRDGN